MISSTQNPKIKWVRALLADNKARRAEQVFVVEGVRLAEEALESGWLARQVLYTAELSDRGQEVVEGFRSRAVPVDEITPEVMKSTSDTQSPQGILAVLEVLTHRLTEVLDFALILDGVRDPGNLGTILRTARAAGVQAVLLPPETADPFAPKVVRAAMGAHFRLPIFMVSWAEIADMIQKSGLRVYLTDAQGGTVYTNVDFHQPLVIILGGEAGGAGRESRILAGESIYIPMPGGSESLNAAAAAAIILFEVARQRLSALS